jgi:class 3 adenylate cyclase/TPR repeat protein
LSQARIGTGEVRLVYCLGIDLIESTMPGLRMTQVELDRFNRALVAQIEPHLEALRFDDLLIKFTGDGWLLMSPEVRDAERLCALATLMRDTFAVEMQRRTGLPSTRIPHIRMAICTGRDIRIQLWHGSFDWVGDSARRANRSAAFCFPNEILIDSSVHSLVMRDFLTSRVDPGSRPIRSVKWEEEIPLWSLEELRIEAAEDWDAAAAYVYVLSQTGRLDDAAEASLRAASQIGGDGAALETPGDPRTIQRWNRLIANSPSYESILELMTRLMESPTAPDAATLVALVERSPTFDEAVRWVANLRLKGVRPDEVVYSALMARAPDFEVALDLLEDVEVDGVAATVDMLHVLISKAPSFRRALKLLTGFADRGVRPDLGVFGRLVARAPGYDAAIGVLDLMHTWSVTPDASVLNRVIAAAPDSESAGRWLQVMIEQRIPPDAQTFNTLIARVPRYGEAMDLLAEMRRQNVAPDVTTFNTLMARAPDQELALDLLRQMESSGVSPSAETFKTLIARSTDYATAVGWLAEMGRRGVRPNNEVFKALIGRAPDFETASAWLRDMPSSNVSPNAETYRTLIGRAPDFGSAVALLEEMEGRGVPANIETFKTLAALGGSEGLGERLLDLLDRSSVRPTAEVFLPLISGAESLETALAWLDRMRALGLDPTSQVLTTLLQKAEDYEQATTVMRRLSPIVEPNEGAFRALVERSTEFDTARTWVERMRDEGMRPEVGVLTSLLSKPPGSWDGDTLLRWYLSLDHHPSGPMGTAIETHRLAGRIGDALRLALDYPHLDASRDLFRLHPDAATETYGDLLASDPGHPNGQYAMGLALLELHRTGEAITHLELAKELARPGPRVAALEEIIRAAQS